MAVRKQTGWSLPNTGTFTQSLGTGAALFGRSNPIAGASTSGEAPVGAAVFGTEQRAGDGSMLDYYLEDEQRKAIDDWQKEEKEKGSSWSINNPPTIPESKNKRTVGDNTSELPDYEAFAAVPLDIAQYESLRDQLAAMNRLGVKSPAAEKELANIAKRLRDSQLQLQDQLGNIKEGEWQAFADNVNELYGIDAAEIQRTKEFLLKDLGLRNEQRDAQTEFLRSKFGIIDERLDEALEATRIRRDEGTTAMENNKRLLRNNAAARGAWMSQGHWDDKAREDQTLAELMLAMDNADRGSRTTAKEDRGEVQFQIDDIGRERKEDELRWAEDNAGLDADKGRLDSNRKKNYADYLYGLKAEREKKAERDRERFFRELERQQQIKSLQQRYAADLAQAELAATLQAQAQFQQMEQANWQNQWQQWQATGQNARPSDAQYLKWIQAGGFPGHDAPQHIIDTWRAFQDAKFAEANGGARRGGGIFGFGNRTYESHGVPYR